MKYSVTYYLRIMSPGVLVERPLDSCLTTEVGEVQNGSRKTSSYIMDSHEKGLTTIVFSLNDGVGALAKALKKFQDNSINLKHIESRSSKRLPDNYEFVVQIEETFNIKDTLDRLKDGK